ncbi:hypothetical protein LOC67_24915 [Stieleria sp. JC731]|uniref:hypothetical protein n=1 Tax=Pirellulaceae TaxID=2691357 RepID=UPI001E38D0E4|nr:hypothetical protein [Stieleria sp. JC731]MCC9603806.1 hypothetical protein [Stieleria sp. JC731]
MIRPTESSPQTDAWRLWIDRCGGYALFAGDQLTVGGVRQDDRRADIAVQSDWRRIEGTLHRHGGDYFWTTVPEKAANFGPSTGVSVAAGQTRQPGQSSAIGRDAPKRQLLVDGSRFPIAGSASMRIRKPSVLSASAVLELDAPHRFDAHVDKVLIAAQTLLIGPTVANHICCPGLEISAVLVIRDGKWKAKLNRTSEASRFLASDTPREFVDLIPGQRTSLGPLDMMLEEV